MKRYNLILMLMLTLLSNALYAQRKFKDGTVAGSSNDPESSAVLELESNDKAFLPPRMSTSERNSIATPAAGLIIYNTDIHCLEYYNNSNWTSKCSPTKAAATISTYDCNVGTVGTLSQGNPSLGVGQIISLNITTTGVYNIGATANGVTFASSGEFTTTGLHTIVLAASGNAVASGTNTFTYGLAPVCTFSRTTAPPLSDGTAICDNTRPTTIVPVTLSDGKVWMDRNLGASRVAQSQTDYQAFGCQYQWGRGNDGHANMNNSSNGSTPGSATTTIPSTTDVPGFSEFILNSNSLYDWKTIRNDNLWQKLSDINNPCPSGYRIPTTAELQAVTSSNALAASNGFTLGGQRESSNGQMYYVGVLGAYWSSDTVDQFATYVLIGNSFFLPVGNAARAMGMSVRCIKN